jgi:hypothetical protein
MENIPRPPGLPAPSKEAKARFNLPSVQEDVTDLNSHDDDEKLQEGLASAPESGAEDGIGRPSTDGGALPRAFTDLGFAQQYWKPHMHVPPVPMHPHMMPGMLPSFMGMGGYMQPPPQPGAIQPLPLVPEGAPTEILDAHKKANSTKEKLDLDLINYDNQRLKLERMILEWQRSMMLPPMMAPPPSQPPPPFHPGLPVPMPQQDSSGGRAFSVPMPPQEGLGGRAHSEPLPPREKDTKAPSVTAFRSLRVDQEIKDAHEDHADVDLNLKRPPFLPLDATEESRELSCTKDEAGNLLVTWPVDSRKLVSTDKQVISPQFAAAGAYFRLMLKPTSVGEKKGQASFRKAKGRGFIEVKLVDGVAPKISFYLSVGVDDKEGSPQVPRGPVQHDFGNGIVCGLPPDKQEWNFAEAVESSTGTFQVQMKVTTEET